MPLLGNFVCSHCLLSMAVFIEYLFIDNACPYAFIKPLLIEPGSPWENGCIESFNSKMRDELLNREIFNSVKEAKILIEQ